MKILHICNDYRDNSLYSIMFNKLNDLGTSQTVFIPFKHELVIDKNTEFNIIHSACYNNIDRLFFYRKSNKIYKSLKSSIGYTLNNIELVHAHTMYSNGYVANKIKKEYGIEYVVSVRSTDIEIFFKKMIWLRKIGINILLQAKKIIFLSTSIERNLLSLIKDYNLRKAIEEKSIVITNGIDDFWFNNLNSKSELSKSITISQVGWINDNKNQLNAFKAIELLNETGIECNLKIVGGVEYEKDKNYFKNLEEYILKSQFKNKVQILDRQNKEELIRTYRKSDIYLMPSFKETFGLVYIEALSQGLPIVYSNNQGVDGLFKDKPVGVAVNPNNPHDIAKGIEMIAKSYTQLTNNIGVQLNRFKWDNVVEEILYIYKDSQ